jgi:diaminopimelate epimerase
MKIKFEKMQALGNDFMVLDLVRQQIELSPALIRQWSDRHVGVGFDQLLLVLPATAPQADFYYGIYNADGSEAEQCGNGARCVADFIHRHALSDKKQLTLQTKKYLMSAKQLDDNQYRVSLSVPQIEALQEEVVVAGQTYSLSILSVGNPHAVLLVDDVNQAPVQMLGPLVEMHDRFPAQTNVEFLQIISSSEVKLRVWERGAGETLACGSGAVAAVTSAQAQGLLGTQVNVSLPGGELLVEWLGGEHEVFLCGGAECVYAGEIEAIHCG